MPKLILTIAIAIAIIAVLYLILAWLWKKLRENESLKYEFITIIAHKFRTPLTHIKWSVEGLLKSEQDQYKKQVLSDIGTSDDKLIKMTNTLIELTDTSKSVRASYKLERLNLCELAKTAVENSKTAFHEKNLFIATNYSEPEIFVKADRSRMEFVLQTLLENACAYTSPGLNISVSVFDSRRKAALSVTDNGIGIAREDLPRIFTKFFRTKEARAMDTEGFGVGLYLAKSIVNRHKGKLSVSSAGLSQGSTFSVVLPRVK